MLQAELDSQYFVVPPWASWFDWRKLSISLSPSRGPWSVHSDSHSGTELEFEPGPYGGGIVRVGWPAHSIWPGLTAFGMCNKLLPRGITVGHEESILGEVRYLEKVPSWCFLAGDRDDPDPASVTIEHAGASSDAVYWLLECASRCNINRVQEVIVNCVSHWGGNPVPVSHPSGPIEKYCCDNWSIPPGGSWHWYRIDGIDEFIGRQLAIAVYSSTAVVRPKRLRLRSIHVLGTIEGYPEFRRRFWSSP